ncbi:hypothetical protein FEM03_02565 [Phragmitibacter flavus]|uniref:Uncharacterized protein n=1 Tax=Phragmitibacter flavus TaxID=2576071 RepID=A0A5R8KJ28_9BACT|nr:hypothetical protein [Phragmitibacter flavus]TLD72257.1 hypothetical protein FEM03_02565 [Phragmitibacter flavus]
MRFSFLFCFLVLCNSAVAQKDTAHHREVYAEINKNEGSYQKVKASYGEDETTFEIVGFFDGATLRKIVARVPGEDGNGHDEYYVENGQPLFVFNTYDSVDPVSEKDMKVENRLYFKDGRMVKWLDTKKKPVDPKSEDFQLEAERLTTNFKNFVVALKAKR